MYCKSCKSLMNENNNICPKCGLDNNLVNDETTEIYLNKITNPRDNKRKNQFPIIVTLIFFLAIGIILVYIFKDTESNDNVTTNTTTTTTIQESLNYIVFNDIKIFYNDSYDISENVIYLKDNNNVNIKLFTITNEEYLDYINSNDIFDDKLGEFETKSFPNDNSYSHLLLINNNYYKIDVNYNEATDNEEIQLELSRIINTITLK